MGYVSIGTKAVGSIVKIKENGAWVEYIIVHQGLPSSLYDASCDGTWVLRKEIAERRQWHSSDANDYANSTLCAYLNSTFLARFDASVQSAIKQVKIPYRLGNGYSLDVSNGSNGLPCKIFSLSGSELGFTPYSNLPQEGSRLAYFITGSSEEANDKRIGYLNSSAVKWWVRSPCCNSITGQWPEAFLIGTNGNLIGYSPSKGGTSTTAELGVRPTFILSAAILVLEDGITTVNSAPAAPSISVPASVNGGRALTVSWGTASDADGNLSGYKLERKVGNGAWGQVYAGTAQSYTDAIIFGWASVAYRVKTYDAVGAESGYTTSPTRTVRNNYAPVISGSDGGLGMFSAAPPTYTYSVADANGDAVTSKVYFDGALLQTLTPALGSSYSLTFSAADWRKVLNGSHTWRIDADDHDGGTASRTVTFVKAVTQIKFTTALMAADAMPTKAIINYTGYVAPGAALTVEICNNARDASPTWEDCTDKVLHGKKHFFANTAKMASAWGVALRATVDRDSATETSFISQIGGNFG